MSSTELYRVSSNGDAVWHCDFSNAFRGAFLIWKNLGERYISPNIIINHVGLERVEKLQWRDDIPVAHRIVLMSTFDTVVVHRERIPRLIRAYNDYREEDWDTGNVPLFSFELDKLFLDRDCTAICWNQTSVNSSIWTVHEYKNDRDDEGTFRPYNIFTGTDHWFLFDRLEEIEEKQL